MTNKYSDIESTAILPQRSSRVSKQNSLISTRIMTVFTSYFLKFDQMQTVISFYRVCFYEG